MSSRYVNSGTFLRELCRLSDDLEFLDESDPGRIQRTVHVVPENQVGTVRNDTAEAGLRLREKVGFPVGEDVRLPLVVLADAAVHVQSPGGIGALPDLE